jgi:DNA-binding winged helix-turn-helix (wHTH) protein
MNDPANLKAGVPVELRPHLDAIRQAALILERGPLESWRLRRLGADLQQRITAIERLTAVGPEAAAATDPSVPWIEGGGAEHSSHWADLYQDLAALERSILDRRLRGAGGDGVADDDANLLRASIRQLEERRRYWREQAWLAQGMVVDRASRTVTFRGRTAALTKRELGLLGVLLEATDRPMPPRQLIHLAWGNADLREEQLRTYVSRLRRRFAEIEMPASIVVRKGRGYTLVMPPSIALATSAPSADTSA